MGGLKRSLGELDGTQTHSQPSMDSSLKYLPRASVYQAQFRCRLLSMDETDRPAAGGDNEPCPNLVTGTGS